MIRKFDNFINEKAPVNMDFYNKQENVPFFDEDQLSSLGSIGFNHVTKHYATMMEGDYLIKALPIMTGKQHKWLHKILIKIYLIDKNGRPEFIEKGEFFVREEGLSSTIFNDGRRINNPGLITTLTKTEIIKFIIDTIPTMGLHDNSKHEINLDGVTESVMNFKKFNTKNN